MQMITQLTADDKDRNPREKHDPWPRVWILLAAWVKAWTMCLAL